MAVKKILIFLAAAGAALACGAPSWAQAGATTGGQMPSDSSHINRSLMNQEQFNNLSEYADRARRLTNQDKARGKTLAELLAEDKAAAIDLVKAMPLSCEVTDAMQVAEGPVVVDGKTVNTKTYEVSCTNGLGYFLVSQDVGAPYGFSCYAADATHAADVAAKRSPGPVCDLPANADLKVMGTKMLGLAGVKCTVRDYRWVGMNSAAHTEFDEFACREGPGFMVISALPGSQIPVHVETCPQSAARNLPCKYSDNGAPLVTLQTFRDALAQHNVACDATDGTMRVIGQENEKKRYVVEFKCSQRPQGLVAFIPLNGNAAPFEALDCQAAAKHGAHCTLTPAKP